MDSNYSVLAQLPDDQLLAEVTRLATRERQATTDLIASLAVLDERRLYLREGYSSLFSYCTKALGLSEDAAYFRIEAARAARRFPSIFERLASGAITLTGVKLLAPHLREDNYERLLDAARGRSKREIELLVVEVQPRPDVPASVRKVPTRKTPLATLTRPPSSAPVRPADHGLAAADVRTAPTSADAAQPSLAVEVAFDRPASGYSPHQARPAVVAPLSPERYKVQMTISAETYARLQRAQALLRHAIPNGDPAAIFDRALVLLVEKLERRKWGARTGGKRVRKSEPVETRARERSAGRRAGGDHRTGGAATSDRMTSRLSTTGRRGSAAFASHQTVSQSGGERPIEAVDRASAVELVPERVRSAGQPGDARPGEAQRSGRGAPSSAGGNSPEARSHEKRGDSRRIPAGVRRAVWLRAGGRCCYVGRGGKRCEATSRLEFHHLVPYVDGGQATADGLTLLCPAHHALETERWFGERPKR